MKLYNIKHPQEQVTFSQAVLQGLGTDQGLFFPQTIPSFSEAELNDLLALPDFQVRAIQVLTKFIGDEFSEQQIASFVHNAFVFDVPVVKVNDRIGSLELFHGPTLAFKDFGARFMAQVLNHLAKDKTITILTATSGDTGAAVAHAFYGLNNIDVVILYPKGKISKLQEKLFCCLGKNIRTIAVNGDFDACQALVKTAFDDQELKSYIGLNSANSINISRLLAQITYYFEAYAQLSEQQRQELVISVPSGNFGDLTAGLIAKAMGLPIKRFVAACNANDTVPRFLSSGAWEPHKTHATLSNAMDVSKPNNWPRIMELYKVKGWDLADLHSVSVSDQTTAQVMKAVDQVDNYVLEPHGAVGYYALEQDLEANEYGIFLETAHPAKFLSDVERILDKEIAVPSELQRYMDSELLSLVFDAEYDLLKTFLNLNYKNRDSRQD